jgi:hypothetical protein
MKTWLTSLPILGLVHLIHWYKNHLSPLDVDLIFETPALLPSKKLFISLFTEPYSFNSSIREVWVLTIPLPRHPPDDRGPLHRVIPLHSTFRSTSLGVKTLTRTSSLRWYPTESLFTGSFLPRCQSCRHGKGCIVPSAWRLFSGLVFLRGWWPFPSPGWVSAYISTFYFVVLFPSSRFLALPSPRRYNLLIISLYTGLR